jgi:transcriptional regulator with XRE-family HTH domain
MLLRIGEKVINKQKIDHTIEHILDLRSHGFSQQETANRLHLDRTFISRLESIGEIRKGGRVAMIGFPIANCNELRQLARESGLEYHLLLSEKERWEFVQTKSGVELFNKIMAIIATLRQFDIVIILASNMRIKLMEAMLDKAVIAFQIGESPIEKDVVVNLERVKALLDTLQHQAGDER